MVLEIRLGCKKEKRLMRHLKMEHPSVRGNIRIRKGTRKSISKIVSGVPNFEKQAEDFTQLKILKGRKK